MCKIGDLIKSLTITLNVHISNFMLSFAHFFQDFIDNSKDEVAKSISYEIKIRQGVTLRKTLIISDVINIGTRGVNRECRWTYS